MKTQTPVKRTGQAYVAARMLAALAAAVAMSGMACERKPSPTTSAQASAKTGGLTASAPAGAANAEPVSTAPAATEPVGANASLGDYLTEQASDQRARAHEQSAVFALGDIKTLLAQKEYASARDAAKGAVKDYADTKYARDFVDVLAESEKQTTAAKEAQAQLQAQIDRQSDEDRRARQERFERQRDDGLACLTEKNYPSAIYYFQAALKEQDDAQVQSLLEQAIDKSTNPRIAVGDFAVAGDVGVTDAGRSVAEILLTKFDPTKFQLVERSRLSALLDEKDLAIAGIVDNPKLLAGKKVKGVKFLVLGTVGKLGTLVVSARLVDVASGEIVQTAEIEARDAVALQGQLDELAAMLAMTAEQKQAYLTNKDRQAQREAQQEAEKRDAAEAAARDAHAREQFWRQRQREALLQRQQHEHDAAALAVEIKALIERGLYPQAVRYARQAIMDFSDTPSAMELTDLRASAEREMIRQALAQKQADAEAQRQAAALEAHLQFARRRQDGLAAYRRDDYRQAIAAFGEALRFEDSDEVRNLLRQAQAKLKVDEDRAYADAMGRAAGAMREGRWGDALEAYQGALAMRKTSEAQDGVAAAKKSLQQQAQYRQMLEAANGAMTKGDYKTAWQWITAAAAALPEAPEAKALALQLGPTAVVRSEVGGKDYPGAKVTLDGKPVKGGTPVNLRLRKGDEQEIVVTIPPQGDKSYLPEKRTVRPAQDGFQELVFQVKEVKLPTKTPEQIAREKKYGEAIQAANDAIADLDYRKAWLRIHEAMTTDPAGQEAKDLAARLGPTLGVKALLDGKDYAGAQVSIDGKLQGQATPAGFRFKKGQTYKISVAIPAKGGKTYTADEMTFKADENDYKEFAADISEVKKPSVPDVPPIPKPEVAPTTKPVVIPPVKPPVETPAEKAEKAKKLKYETTLEAAAEAMKAGDYKAAWEQIAAALALDPAGEEAKALADKLGPVLTVTATLDGKACAGAQVSINGEVQAQTTPTTFRLKKGQTHKVSVTIPAKGGKTYTADDMTFKADKNECKEFTADISQVKAPPVPATVPAVTPATKPAAIVTPKPPVETPAEKAKRLKYEAALEAATEAIKTGDYKAAWEQIDAALALDPAGEEAKALAEKLGPTLTVTAELNGRAVKGATVTLAPPLPRTARAEAPATPASLRLAKGQAYEVTVSLPPEAGKSFTPDQKAIKADKNGPYEFHAVLKEVAAPVAPPPAAPTPPVLTPVRPTSLPTIRSRPTSEPAAAKPKTAQYQEAVRDAKDAIEKKDYKTAWEQIELALTAVPDGREAHALGEKLGPTLTVKAMLDGAEYAGARVSLNGEPQTDTTPSAFELKPGQTYKIEVTIVKRGKSYTTDAKTITPAKTGNTEFVAVIKETK